ncbi:cdc42 effector protein 2 [Boleophthalmus pectinirostris]|uniref:cdc42 effector protein 2 n=1 Tax=Boleophthalmus pectinirostris TaxID=150288 RepID=UPI000A1C5B6A|nr:cdc42 effector protein 2 [Boleophthalmus pectinirostris]
MPAKTPIYLKTPTDRRGRKLKLREVLSGDMISPPLGDVRHSAHVGLQGMGDMFGDVAFLQGNMDMLPPPNGHGSSPQALHPHQSPYDSNPQPLWTTTSLPLLMAQEDAPPKPPRLHLDIPRQHGPESCSHLDTPAQHGSNPCPHLDTPTYHGPTLCAQTNISLSPTIQQLVPLSNSSSEDSLLDTCRPLGVSQGLSLDSDAGLSNEDLRSDGSPLLLPISTTLPHSESMAALNLDLGPSIMDDILRIMDRYRGSSPAPGL